MVGREWTSFGQDPLHVSESSKKMSAVSHSICVFWVRSVASPAFFEPSASAWLFPGWVFEPAAPYLCCWRTQCNRAVKTTAHISRFSVLNTCLQSPWWLNYRPYPLQPGHRRISFSQMYFFFFFSFSLPKNDCSVAGIFHRQRTPFESRHWLEDIRNVRLEQGYLFFFFIHSVHQTFCRSLPSALQEHGPERLWTIHIKLFHRAASVPREIVCARHPQSSRSRYQQLIRGRKWECPDQSAWNIKAAGGFGDKRIKTAIGAISGVDFISLDLMGRANYQVMQHFRTGGTWRINPAP